MIRARKHGSAVTTPVNARSNFVWGLSALALLPGMAQAQEAAPEEPLPELAPVIVQGRALDANPNAEDGVPYKARTSGDDRHTRPLAETPQTLSVLTKAAIEDSGYTDLKRILGSQPGITLGTGENGNAFGDRYIIRGQEARSDVFVDGLRDPGMTTRESFAVEQLEISKGPNSSFAGRGTSGGAVNAITKQATTALNFAKLSPSVGTDQYRRITLDANHAFGEHLAVRANVLYAYEDVPDRAPADRERKGAALSAHFVPSAALDLTLDYYGVRADDNPDLGSYLTGTVPNRRPAQNIPVYAQQEDFLKSNVNTGTARLKYEFSPAWRLTNLLRYGESSNGYVTTGVNGVNTGINNPGGTYATTSLNSHQGWQEVEYLANQTNLFFTTPLLGRDHTFIFSLEYSDHKVLNGVYTLLTSGQNCVTGTSATPNEWCIFGPDGSLVDGITTMMNRQNIKGTWDSDWRVKTTSAALMDTFNLTDRLALFAGVRADRFDFDLATQDVVTLARADYDYSDTLINGQLGLTLKTGQDAMVYASIATASDINGGESDVGANSGYGGVIIEDGQVAGADPESSVNLELGTKWDLFDHRLLLTGALFQTTKSDVMEGVDYDSVGSFNTGKNRVRGVEVSVIGELLPRLTVQAGATYMKSKVLESAVPESVGKTLSNFAERSMAVQFKYDFTDNFSLGVAGKYESEKFGGQPDSAAVFNPQGEYTQRVQPYTLYDAFATYRLNPNMEFRLNVLNLTDKDYYLAVYRTGLFLYKGDARAVRLTFNYDL